jgi:hypothetical protein
MLDQPFFIPASILLILALPLILGLIPPNRVYGIRTAKALTDKRVWYQVNRFGGWIVLASSLFYLAVAWRFPSVIAGETDFGRWLLHVGAFVGPLIVGLSLMRGYAKQL